MGIISYNIKEVIYSITHASFNFTSQVLSYANIPCLSHNPFISINTMKFCLFSTTSIN